MSTTHNVRTAIDNKLDKMEKYLERIEAQISETKKEAVDKFNEVKSEFQSTLDITRSEIDKIPDLASEKKEQLFTMLADLKAVLDENTSEAKDNFSIQREEIKNTIDEFEVKAKAFLGEKYQSVVDDFEKLGDTVHAHLNALEQQYEVERNKKTKEFDEKKDDFKGKVKKWKSVLQEKRSQGVDRLDTFESEFMEGVQSLNSAFKNLFK